MKILVCGDPHAKAEDLADLRALAKYIKEVALKEGAEYVLFTGDQNHHHSIVNVECIKFWNDTCVDLTGAGLAVIMLVGNHDKAANGDKRCNSLIPYMDRDGVQVVMHPMRIGKIAFAPHFDSNEEFINEINDLGGKTLICHQTFQGARYETGFYAEDGVDPNLISQEYVISGHIHTPSSFGKVVYVGSPRALTISDANVDRSIVLFEFNGDGVPVSSKSFSTNGVCTQVIVLKDTPEAPEEIRKFDKAKVTVDVCGPKSFVDERRKLWEATGARVRPFPDREKRTEVRESDGIFVAFNKFIDTYNPATKINKEELKKAVLGMLNVVET